MAASYQWRPSISISSIVCECTHLALMECLGFDLPLLFKSIYNILISPPNLVRETLWIVSFSTTQKMITLSTYPYCTVLSSWLQPQHPQRIRYNHPLLLIIWWRNSLEKLEAFESCSTPSCLMRDHASDRPVKNLGWCAMMKGSWFFGVDNMTFVKEIMVTKLSRSTCQNNYSHSMCSRPCSGRNYQKCSPPHTEPPLFSGRKEFASKWLRPIDQGGAPCHQWRWVSTRKWPLSCSKRVQSIRLRAKWT